MVATKSMTELVWSPTKLNMFLRCPAQYYYRYVLGLKEPPKSSLVLGSSVDSGLNHNLEQKIETDEDLKLDAILGAYEQTFDAKVKETPFEDAPVGEIKDLGVGLIKAYQMTIAPTVHPAEVQAHLTFEVNGVKVQGYEDVFTKDCIQIDNKTSKKSPSKNPAGGYDISSDYATQMGTYRLGRKSMKKTLPKACRFDFMVKLKNPIAIPAPFVPEGGFEALEGFVGRQYQRADALVKREVFIPQRGNFMCSPEHCGFYRRCRAEF